MSMITPQPCPPSGGGGPEFDAETVVLCDILPDGTVAGSAIAVYKYDEATGAPVGAPTFVIPGTNTPYVAQGILQPCDEPCVKCDTAVLCDNTTTPAHEIVTSTIKMLDTPNVAGDDGWNVTAFNTGGAVNTPQVCPGVSGPPLPVPYPAFYNADWCTAWLAGCPSGTPAGGGCALNPGPALGLTSNFESVNCGVGSGFADSCGRYLLEKTFNTDASCTKIRVTSQRFRADGSAKVLIDGQATGIFGAYNASSPDGTVILTVAPGPHTMTIDLRDSEAPTWVQGGLTIECLDIAPAGVASVQFLRTTCRTCTGNIVSVKDTTLDGQTPYVPTATVTICDPGASNIPTPCSTCQTFVLADRVTGLDAVQSCITFLRQVCFNCDGTVSSTRDTLLDGTSPYTPTGNVGLGCDYPEDEELLCDFGGIGGIVTFTRTFLKDPNGIIVKVRDADLSGAAYTVVGPIGICRDTGVQVTTAVFCDNNGPFIREFVWDNQGSNIAFADFTIGGANYLAVGPVKVCDGSGVANDDECLQDNNGVFFRRTHTADDGTVTITTVDVAGNPYVPVGTVTGCGDCQHTIELIGRCDYTGAPGALGFTSFFERLTWDCNGVLVSADTITPTGTPYVPTGTVKTGLCDPEITQEILCDSAGTKFLRRYSWTDRQVGVNQIPLVRFDDFALDGVTAFAPVGAVSTCADCCPTVIGEGCATGGRKWTALRATDGTVTLLNQATGAVILPADVVACTDLDAQALPSVAAHHFDVVPGAPWIPAVIPAGRLIGLSYTVVAGTVTTVDADATSVAAIPTGYAANWNVGDDRETLVPVASITAAAASRAIVTMTVATP